MAGRVLKRLPQNVEFFKLKEFASDIEKGEKPYDLRFFSVEEESSVQDSRNIDAENTFEPATVENRDDEVTDADYLPPSKLAKANDGVVGSVVEMPAPSATGEFVESPEFSDVQEEQKDYPGKIVRSAEFELASEEQAKIFAAEKEVLEKKIEELSAKIVEKEAELNHFKDEQPLLLEKVRYEGRAEGIEEAEATALKQYTVQKEDYFSRLDVFNKKALDKLDEIDKTINNIDEEMTTTVIGFVNAIIGAERRVSDTFVVRLIKANTEKLKELKVVSFQVNPDDVEVMEKNFKSYPVEGDPSIERGAVRVISKVGEVDLSAESMLAGLEKQIDEAVSKAQKS